MVLQQVRASESNAHKATVEQTYQKLTQHQHILQRPDTYVGSIESVTQDMWVFDAEEGRMKQRKLTYVPGLYKTFDEILVNAADNKQRDASMSEIRVEIDKAKGRISILNNGKGVPVTIHKEHGIYVPELIFGHLLTSSNYNDQQKKVTGGRNGYGAKLANIFSTEFVVETADSAEGKRFKQVFRNNMRDKSEPQIKPSKEDWTKISWVPDLAKFGMQELDDDIIALMERRAYDMAGCTHASVKVYLNGKRLQVNDFKSYIELFLGPARAPGSVPRVFERVGDRWEVAVAASDDGFTQVSFVNSIATSKGGTHVGHVTDQVVERVLEHLKKKHKGLEKVLKPNHVKSHLRIFINCLIENPAFDSQTKENMTLKASAFGSKCSPSDKFFKDSLNCGVLEAILSFAQSKQSKDLKKTDGSKKQRLTGISKLDDANEAGGRNGYKCTLIITEGDSAKALAVSGLSVIGRDYHGVFPLRGKLLNVRDANHSTIMNNKEISELKQILGLQQGKDYTDPASLKSLRYGHLMIMTDQDHDGSHIKGLVINFLHCYWPSLLKHHDFLREFVTPIVKVSKGRVSEAFFTIKEYKNWVEAQGSSLSGWNIKYYKGLGTSSAAEGKGYFSDLPKHELTFKWEGDEDRTSIERAFSKSMADARKEWLRQYDPDVYVDHTRSHLSYTTFVDKELIHFSNADNLRSIPAMLDGLKPGQRKILFSCFKRGKAFLKNEVKVAQLAGYVSEHSAYHHGEQSLAGTIVGMAQGFTGSNNISLLYPSGQFGTRLMGGKDAASPRYIFTKLPQLTRLIFHPDDDALLNFLEEDGQSIEPAFYVPILPMVLVNGADGIGTGWSTNVPNYNPREIVANLRRMMDGEEPLPMDPWYRGFNGTVTQADSKGTYLTYGVVSKLDSTTLKITELPVRKWTQDYKESVIEPMVTGGEKAEASLQDLRENHTDTTVNFTLKFTEEALAELEKKGLHKALKLSSSIATSNMTLFDDQMRICKFETAESLLRAFYSIRLSFYEKRKLSLSDKLSAEWSKLDNKVRFVLAVVSGELKISNRKKAELVEQLRRDGYAPFEPTTKKSSAEREEDEVDEESPKEASARSYDYLLGMPLWSLTFERVEQLRSELAGKEAELQALLRTTPKQLWTADLDAFLAGLDEYEAHFESARQAQLGYNAKKKGGKAGGRKRQSDDEVESDSDYEERPKKKKAPAKPAKSAAAAIASPAAELVAANVVPVPPAPPPKPVFTAAAAKPAGPKQTTLKLQPAPIPKARPNGDGGNGDGDDDSDDGQERVSLADRLMGRGNDKRAALGLAAEDVKTAEAKGPKKARAGEGEGKRKLNNKAIVLDSEDDDDDDDDDDDESFGGDDSDYGEKPKVVKAAAKPKAPAKPRGRPPKAAKAKVGSDDADDAADDFVVAKPVKAKAAPKLKPPARKAKAESESEDESGSQEPAPRAAPEPRRGGPRRAAAEAAKKYIVLDESDDDESDDESE